MDTQILKNEAELKDLNRLICPKELAIFLKITRSGVYSLIREKKLTPIRVGRLKRFLIPDVLKEFKNEK